jgi:hypothetical protein
MTKKAQLPNPLQKRKTVNMAEFWLAANKAPLIMDTMEKIRMAGLGPTLSMRYPPRMTPKTEPAWEMKDESCTLGGIGYGPT